MRMYNGNRKNNSPSFEPSHPEVHHDLSQGFVPGPFNVERGPNGSSLGEEAIHHLHQTNHQYRRQDPGSPANSNQYPNLDSGLHLACPNTHLSPGLITNWHGQSQIVSSHRTNLHENWSPALISSILQGPKNYHCSRGGNQATGLTQSVKCLHLTPSRSASGISWETTEGSGVISQLESPVQSVTNSNKQHKKFSVIKKRDSNPNFTIKDYKNVCNYLENEDNYNRLFGKTTKMNVGERLMTRKAAYKLFAGHLNSLNLGLALTGRHCEQRFSNYKKKNLATRMWAANTGAGLSEEEMGMTIQKKLETMCPCYERMNQIFVSKPNVIAFNELNTTSQDPINVGSPFKEDSDLEAFSDCESGISAYEQLHWHLNRTKKRKDTKSNDQITVNKGPKGNWAASKRASMTQGAMGNLKQIHEQENRQKEDISVWLLKDFVYLKANKWSDE
ncbi:hypothetical protein O181_101421 [Austropuccinia psidii MF-1]|uniref:Uncharacterized protein n=1 Tax=Austropuccinia psidii MF-1 TaxID=1389203 RepID=A0A9Q3JH37_9BASI|nr:hypothetical protein [Austropuccinia psidii MF-1]